MRLLPVAFAASLPLAFALAATDAGAATSAANASNPCQGALPAFETQIRKRPLGVNNEGTATAFVSCSTATGYNPSTITAAIVIVTNRNAGPIDIDCTLVNGGIAGAVSYHPKTHSAPAGTPSVIAWTPADVGGALSMYQNFSCALPPNVDINVVGYDYS